MSSPRVSAKVRVEVSARRRGLPASEPPPQNTRRQAADQVPTGAPRRKGGSFFAHKNAYKLAVLSRCCKNMASLERTAGRQEAAVLLCVWHARPCCYLSQCMGETARWGAPAERRGRGGGAAGVMLMRKYELRGDPKKI